MGYDETPSQARFDDDRRREQVLATFLDQHFYPEVATEFNRQTNIEKQRVGHDLEVQFEWLDEPVIVDEKAQSGKWLNDPAPTFVMEIFGESWVSEGTAAGSTGWFVDDENETEYYVLVWLPAVSRFEVESGLDDPFLSYYPADGVLTAEDTAQLLEFMQESDSGEYRMTLSGPNAERFENIAEPLPVILFDGERRAFGREYYGPENIHDAKIAVVEKERIKRTFEREGLDKERLVELGNETIVGDRDIIPLETPKAKSVMRSHRPIPYSNREENPVNLIVNYGTYHELADGVYRIKDQSLSSGEKLF